jgi:hypothetical protein
MRAVTTNMPIRLSAACERREHALDDDRLGVGHVLLDAIGRVHCALAVVMGQRQSLRVQEQPGTEIERQSLENVGAEHPRREVLDLLRKRDRDEQPDGHDECRIVRRRQPCEPERMGKRMRAECAVDGNPERQRPYHRERRRQQAERKQQHEMGGERPRLA